MQISNSNNERRGPCVGGLMAGTLALMTTWAAPATDACIDVQQQRALIARKIVSNLLLLRDHADVCPALRQVIGKVHRRWATLAQAPMEAVAAAEAARLH